MGIWQIQGSCPFLKEKLWELSMLNDFVNIINYNHEKGKLCDVIYIERDCFSAENSTIPEDNIFKTVSL